MEVGELGLQAGRRFPAFAGSYFLNPLQKIPRWIILGEISPACVPKPMPQRSESASGLLSLFRRRTEPLADWEMARARERAESLAILRKRQQDERRTQSLRSLLTLWPVAVGLLLACMAPLLQHFAESIGPWGMTVVFPFVVLARRPEVQMGPMTHLLPTIMLYGQFPIEGWLTRIVLRRQVRAFPVAGHVLLFHFLGIAELLLLSGVLYSFASHTGISVLR